MSEASAVAARLAALVRDATGNVVPPERHGFLAEVAVRRAGATRAGDVDAYLADLAAGRLADEWPTLASLVTIKESYFFRAPQQLAAIVETVLPDLLRARSAERTLRVWSAACARGEEPGSLAILFAESASLAVWDWSIVATDVDAEALASAERGLYGERAVAQVPGALRARWFVPRGKLFELAPELKRRIAYRRLNLVETPYDLPGGPFDLILLRNVLIYFRRPLQRKVANQVARHLAPHGLLFLGASETLWQTQADLEAVDLGPCFCYRPGAPRSMTPEPADSARSEGRPAGGPAPPRRATAAPVRPARSDRGNAVGRRAETAAEADPGAPESRTAKAEASPIEASAPVATSGAAPLARAVRELGDDRVSEAAAAAAAAVAADPGDPAAHALAGFIEDLSGRTERAAAAYRAALYLDAELYQVRLLLADCLLRLGQAKRAEHLFREVLGALGAGRGRDLERLADLPLPNRERAAQRCRRALGG